MNGRVEHTPARQEQWSAARIFQPLLVSERVRTLEASRAAILFVDETQVKLNAGAVLTIREVRSSGGGGTALELSRGEGWFRTKNPVVEGSAEFSNVQGSIVVNAGEEGTARPGQPRPNASS